jgi:hypothetical protein|tara:strand:+ start:460 stop:843 length:384 start_codon:yes stop_codon:yes gene_type:complete
MPYKNKEDLRAYNRRRYEKLKDCPEHKARKKREAAERYKRNKQDPNYLSWKQRILKEHKEVPCASCGESYPYQCMDFHHRNPAEKEFTVSAINGTREQLETEISKCYVLCCMCHRKIHANLLEMIEQ